MDELKRIIQDSEVQELPYFVLGEALMELWGWEMIESR